MSNPAHNTLLTQYRTTYQRPANTSAPTTNPPATVIIPLHPAPCSISYENAAYYVTKVDGYVFQTKDMPQDTTTMNGREIRPVDQACKAVQNIMIKDYNDSPLTADSHYEDQLEWLFTHYHAALRQVHAKQRLPQPMIDYLNNTAEVSGSCALTKETPKSIKSQRLFIFRKRNTQEEAARAFPETCDNIITRLHRDDDLNYASHNKL